MATHCGPCSREKARGHDRGCDEQFQPIAAARVRLTARVQSLWLEVWLPGAQRYCADIPKFVTAIVDQNNTMWSKRDAVETALLGQIRACSRLAAALPNSAEVRVLCLAHVKNTMARGERTSKREKQMEPVTQVVLESTIATLRAL